MKSGSVVTDHLLAGTKKRQCPEEHTAQRGQIKGAIWSKVTAAIPHTATSDPRKRSTPWSYLPCLLPMPLPHLWASLLWPHAALLLNADPSISSPPIPLSKSICPNTAVKSYQVMQGQWKRSSKKKWMKTQFNTSYFILTSSLAFLSASSCFFFCSSSSRIFRRSSRLFFSSSSSAAASCCFSFSLSNSSFSPRRRRWSSSRFAASNWDPGLTSSAFAAPFKLERLRKRWKASWGTVGYPFLVRTTHCHVLTSSLRAWHSKILPYKTFSLQSTRGPTHVHQGLVGWDTRRSTSPIPFRWGRSLSRACAHKSCTALPENSGHLHFSEN